MTEESMRESLKMAIHAVKGVRVAVQNTMCDATIATEDTPTRRNEAEKAAEVSLFRHGPFVSHSGLPLPDKIDCDALGAADWDANAAWVAARVAFGKVVTRQSTEPSRAASVKREANGGL